MTKTIPLSVVLDAAAVAPDELTHRIVADTFRDMAHRYTALCLYRQAARLTREAAYHDHIAAEARAEARFRQPARYGPGRTEREQARSLAAYKGHETRQEAEHMAVVNVDPAHLALWNKIKAGIKGNPHQRWERFAHYVEEHPDEVSKAIAEQVGDYAPPSSRAA